MDSVIEYRRALHRIPELDSDLPETTAFVRSRLQPLRCQILEPIRSSVCAFFDAGKPETAAFRAADRNPYSWNMDFLPYPDGSGYEARFTKCGICALMQKLRLYDLTPAMCRLDYTMSEAGEKTNFVREYTLASGGPYCDCGYKKK